MKLDNYNQYIVTAAMIIAIVIAIRNIGLLSISMVTTAIAALSSDNDTIKLDKPFIIENVKPSGREVIINGGQALMVTFIGNGTINGMNFTQPKGQALITPISNEILRAQGQGVIITNEGAEGKSSGAASFKFNEIDHANPDGSTNGSGAVFFDSNATGTLKSVDNSVGVFKDMENKDGTSLIKVWNWPANHIHAAE